MPEACQTAYRSSTPDIQGKIRRVVDVWKTRNVFETPIIEAIESRLNDIDKAKGTSGKKTLMGKSLFDSPSGATIPKELEALGPLQTAVSKASLDARPNLDAAEREYAKLNDPEVETPPLPVHAARLSGLIKSLTAAESSLGATIEARKALINELEKILVSNKSTLDEDEEHLTKITTQKAGTEFQKREVEDSIMRGLGPVEDSPLATTEVDTAGGNGDARYRAGSFVDERPEVEELTPEPDEGGDFYNPGDVNFAEQFLATREPAPVPLSPAVTSPGAPTSTNPILAATLSGFDDSISAVNRTRVASASSPNGANAKRRKMSHDNDDGVGVPDLGAMGVDFLAQPEDPVPRGVDVLGDLDRDVDELLRQEGGGRF
jgi:regulator of Ty1 transposition protein 103